MSTFPLPGTEVAKEFEEVFPGNQRLGLSVDALPNSMSPTISLPGLPPLLHSKFCSRSPIPQVANSRHTSQEVRINSRELCNNSHLRAVRGGGGAEAVASHIWASQIQINAGNAYFIQNICRMCCRNVLLESCEIAADEARGRICMDHLPRR